MIRAVIAKVTFTCSESAMGTLDKGVGYDVVLVFYVVFEHISQLFPVLLDFLMGPVIHLWGVFLHG